MPSSRRSAASERSATCRNAAPRWLSSITDMPVPAKSVSSSRARSSTAMGSAAGPALKLWTRAPALTVAIAIAMGRLRRGAAGAGAPSLLLVLRQSLDTFQAHERFVATQADQAHALRVAAEDGDIGDRRAHQGAGVADQHDLVVVGDLQCAHHASVPLGGLDGDEPLTAAPLDGELVRLAALAVAVLRGREDEPLREDDERDHLVVLRQADAAHTGCTAAHSPNIRLAETDGLATAREQHDVAVAVREGHVYEVVARAQIDGDDAVGARPRERIQRRLLDRALTRGEEDEFARLEVAHRQHCVDALFLLQRQQIHDGLAPRAAAGLRQLVDLQPVRLAPAGEAQQRVVGVGDEQVVDEVLVLHARGRPPLAAPALRLIRIQRLRLGIAAVRQRHHHVLLGNEVFDGQVGVVLHDLGATLVAELVAHRLELLADQGQEPVRIGQDKRILSNFIEYLLVFLNYLLLLEAGQAMQPQIQDGLGLGLRQAVYGLPALLDDAERAVVGIRPGIDVAGPLQHAGDRTGRPTARDQPDLRFRRRRRGLDQRDHLVDVRQRHGLPLQDVGTVPRLAQIVDRAPGDHLAAMGDERLQNALQRHQLRLTLVQGHHVDAEDALQRRVLVEVVQDHLVHLAALELDHDAHAVLVGLVAQLADALQLLLAHELGDLLDQPGLVDLVRQLGDHDGLAGALADLLDVAAGADVHAAPARLVGAVDALGAVDDAGGGEVRPRHVLHEPGHVDVRVVDHRHAGIDDLAQVVGRNIGGHADRDTGGAVDEQVRDARRQHGGLALGAVVVLDEIDRLLVDVGQQFVGDPGHAHLGVTHGRRGVAVHRAEVALPVHQHVAHRERLRHAHDGVVDGAVAVGMVLTDHVTDDAGRFLVRLVVVVAQFPHRVEDPPMHRLQAVAHVGQGPPHDHAHRVIEIGLAHLVFEIYRKYFLGDVTHGYSHKTGPPPSPCWVQADDPCCRNQVSASACGGSRHSLLLRLFLAPDQLKILA